MPSDVVVNMLAGGLAGATETVATYPLDVAKTRQQLSVGPSRQVTSVLFEVFSEGGARSLYRGLSAPLISEVPRRAMKFTVNGVIDKRLRVVWPQRSAAGDVTVSAVAGAIAGGSETLFHTPFERVKIVVQASGKASGTTRMALDIAQQEGLQGLYRGLEAYAFRQAVWNGAFFGFIGIGKRVLPQEFGGSRTARDFTIGLLAGSTATCINNPLDVAKSRIQVGDHSAQRWSIGVVGNIAQIEGLHGLCKGLPARLYRSAPGHGMLYMGFQFFSTKLRDGFQ